MDAVAAPQQLVVRRGTQQNSVCGDHPPEETGQRPLAMGGWLLIGVAGKGGLATTTQAAG